MEILALVRTARATGVRMLCAGVLAGVASAGEPEQSKIAGGPYALHPTRIAAGAGSAAGGAFSVAATVGQHDATVVSAQGGSYDVEGGIQPAAPPPPPQGNTIFASSVE